MMIETVKDEIRDEIVIEKSIPIPTFTQIPVKQSIAKKRSLIDHIKDKLEDQDFNQKVAVAITVVLEMYRVLVSSFLVLFVPQKCGDHVCSLSENMVLENHLYSAGLVFNFITMASFLAMYTFEVKRENRLITYLEVNKSVPSDNNSVAKVLEGLSADKRDSIWALDKYYQYAGLASIGLFSINTILSGFVVYTYYLDSQTTSTYITNILFMLTKMADVYSTVNTEKNIFYSAYMKGKVQYNDVDPDKVLLSQNKVLLSQNKVLLLQDKKEDNVIEEIKDNVIIDIKIEETGIDNVIEEIAIVEESNNKIIVTVYDISSNPSSSNDLQNLDSQV
jgi:hypothetical protein